DGDALRAARNGDRRLQLIAERSDDLALRADLEAAVAGISELSRGQQDLKITLTVDRQIERVAGLLEAALGHDRLGRDHVGAGALLQARGVVGRLRREAAGLRL